MDWSRIRHFRPSEFAGEMDRALIEQLDVAREYAGVPFTLTSTRRDGDGSSAHDTGHAVDIRCHDSRLRFRILYGLVMAGFDRIGIYDRHIHADSSVDHDAEVVWLGESA